MHFTARSFENQHTILILMIPVYLFWKFRTSKDFVVMDEARSLALELLGLEGKGYQALFLQVVLVRFFNGSL
jgi:hypothetical protein